MTRFCDMTLGRAIGLSIAFHAAFFGSALAFAHYGGWPRSVELGTIVVSLVDANPGKRDGQRYARAVRVRDAAIPLQEPSVVDQHPAATDEHASPPDEIKDERTEVPDSAPVAGEGDALPSASEFPGYSPDEWKLLQSALERAKTYPRFARERGIEGTVLVRFKVRPTGDIDQVDIVRSSGARILDDASVETIYRAAPFPYVKGWIEVPMVYRLQRAEGP